MRLSSAASGVRSAEARGLISMTTFPGEIHQVQRQISVRETGGLCGSGKPGLRVEIAVRVDVDDERLARGVDAQIDAAVVAALERFEGCHRDRDAARLDLAGEHGQLGGALDALG